MSSSIPSRRTTAEYSEHRPVRSRSLRALAVAARLERRHASDGPPGRTRARESAAAPSAASGESESSAQEDPVAG